MLYVNVDALPYLPHTWVYHLRVCRTRGTFPGRDGYYVLYITHNNCIKLGVRDSLCVNNVSYRSNLQYLTYARVITSEGFSAYKYVFYLLSQY